MDKHIFNEDNGLWYELTGDYYLPCVTAPTEEKQAVGVWGQRHLRYIREHKKALYTSHKKALYTSLLTNGKLQSYLADVDKQAQELFDRLMRQRREREVALPKI